MLLFTEKDFKTTIWDGIYSVREGYGIILASFVLKKGSFEMSSAIIQILSFILCICFLSPKRLRFGGIMLMLIGGMIFGIPAFFHGARLGIIPLLLFFGGCLLWECRSLILSILLPLATLILFYLGIYLIEVVEVFFMPFSSVENISINGLALLFVGITISMVAVGLSFLIKFIFERRRFEKNQTSYPVLLLEGMLFLIAVVFQINTFFGQQNANVVNVVQLNQTFFFIYNLLLIGIVMAIFKGERKRMQNENAEIQTEQLQKYVEELEVQNVDVRKFRHDYVNLLLTLEEYIKEDDNSRLKDYFYKKIVPQGEKLERHNVQTSLLQNLKVIEVKGIVSNKLIKAQNLNIQAYVEIEKPIHKLGMDSLDLSRCLGILLDNAIEEAQFCEDAVLRIAFIEKDPELLIIIENSCRAETIEYEKIFQPGYSTKGDNRGLGLSNLTEILNAYPSVILDTHCEAGVFVQKIIILGDVTDA